MFVPWLPPYEGEVGWALVLLVALAVDAAAGDPRWLYRVVPHPAAAIGKLVAALEARWNDPHAGETARLRRGVLMAAIITTSAVAAGWAVSFGLRHLPWGWLAEALLASTFIAYRGLYDHVRAVATGLDSGLDAGRAAVAHIVGRDARALDAPGVARAAIESAAENFADGTVAPVFWFVLFGLPGLIGYKAINTMDSMVGYPSSRHAAFGRGAARLDDAANRLPARLAGGLLVLAALVLPGTHSLSAWRTMLRDAANHRSPNAGWPESAVAGALGLALAGPRRYAGRVEDGPWMGDGRRHATAHDIRRALGLYLAAGAALALLVACGLVF